MSERIMTLFGEEFAPEPSKPAPKARGRKKAAKDDAGEGQEEETSELPVPEEKAEAAPQPEEQTTVPEPVAAASVDNTPEVGPEKPEAEPEIVEMPEAANEIAEDESPVTVAKVGRRKKDQPKPENLPADWDGKKQYYSIGEVAELFKVNTSHIRFWTNEFKIKVRTTRKGDRLYTTDQIKEIRTIHHLVKERGFTLAGAKARLKENVKEAETVDLKQSLVKLREKLVAIKNQLK